MLLLLVYVPHKTQNWHFHIIVVQKWQKNVPKNVMHLQKLLFCLLIKLYFFYVFIAVALFDH